jgi:hypothetical protein
MNRGFNAERGHFCQSYESREVLDASILIAPLVFFVAPNDPRFISTLKRILQSPEKEGLSSAKMVFRYDHLKANDGKHSTSSPMSSSSPAGPVTDTHVAQAWAEERVPSSWLPSGSSKQWPV